jgi:threonine/homoserine/homoserine lactone efflux protein
MIRSLFASQAIAAFLVASLILAVTPGPGVISIVAQTARQGRRAGIASVGGIALGNLANASAASLGLAAIFAVSSMAFSILKLAGAAYLVFLGIKALRTRSIGEALPGNDQAAFARVFGNGLLVAMLNPKTALFFAAFLPQFINPSAAPLAQSLVLGCVFASVALCTDTMYVLTASAVVSKMRRRAMCQFHGRYLPAATYIGLGLYAALSHPRSAK